MKISTSLTIGNITLVNLSGSLDANGADIIDLQMREVARCGTDIAVDLSEVTFISSQGVRILMMTAKAANVMNKKLVLIGPKPPIQKVLVIMGVDKVLNIYQTVDALPSNGTI